MIINCMAILCIALGIMGIKTEKIKLNPITIFSFLWGIIIFFSNMRLYTLYETDIEIYKYIIFGVISFVCGYYSFKIILKNKVLIINKNKTTYKIRKKMCYMLLILCLLFIAKNIIVNRKILFKDGYNLASVQTAQQENDLSSTGLENAISFLIVNPMYISLNVAIIANFLLGDKDFKLFLCLIVLNIGRIITSGGRQSFIQFFFILLIIMSFSQHCKNLEKKIVKKIKGKRTSVIFIGVIVLIVLSLSRSSNIIKTIYLDFAMQPYMFEYWAKTLDSTNSIAYGLSSTMGFIYPVLYICKNFLRIFLEIPEFFSSIYNMNMLPIEKWIYIGHTLKANAYVSIFWYLYYDGRLIGILIGMFILGMISNNIYTIAIKRNDMKNVSLYVMIAIMLFYSFGDMEFSKTNFAIAFIYIITIMFKRNGERNK